jgi:ADP-ribose pyrophosphatase YjhB (NUDIX family)
LLKEQPVEIADRAIIVLVAAAIMKERKILLVREEAEPYNREWVLPQGYVKPKETLHEAIRREVLEELGIKMEVEKLVGIYEDFEEEKQQKLHYIIVCYLSRLIEPVKIHATSEIIDSVWIDPKRGSANSPAIIQKILKDVAKMTGKRFFSIR